MWQLKPVFSDFVTYDVETLVYCQDIGYFAVDTGGEEFASKQFLAIQLEILMGSFYLTKCITI